MGILSVLGVPAAHAIMERSATMCTMNAPWDGCDCDGSYCCDTVHYEHFETVNYICFYTHGSDAGPEPLAHGYVADCSDTCGGSCTCYCNPKAYKNKVFSDGQCWAYDNSENGVGEFARLPSGLVADPPQLANGTISNVAV